MLSGIQDEKLLLVDQGDGHQLLSSSCFYQLMILSHIFHLLYFFMFRFVQTGKDSVTKSRALRSTL